MKEFNYFDLFALILLIVGGLNWGLFGLFGFDLVAVLFGQMSAFAKAVYILVGAGAVYSIYFVYRMYTK